MLLKITHFLVKIVYAAAGSAGRYLQVGRRPMMGQFQHLPLVFGINNFDEKVRDFKQHFRKLKLI
jgi:hypothetical protein